MFQTRPGCLGSIAKIITTVGDTEKQGSICGLKASGEWRENDERKGRVEKVGNLHFRIFSDQSNCLIPECEKYVNMATS